MPIRTVLIAWPLFDETFKPWALGMSSAAIGAALATGSGTHQQPPLAWLALDPATIIGFTAVGVAVRSQRLVTPTRI